MCYFYLIFETFSDERWESDLRDAPLNPLMQDNLMYMQFMYHHHLCDFCYCMLMAGRKRRLWLHPPNGLIDYFQFYGKYLPHRNATKQSAPKVKLEIRD